MNQAARRAAAAAALFLLPAGCAPPVYEPVWSPCRAIGSSDWSAELRIVPSHHNKPILQRMVAVTGKVTVPGPGYSVTLEPGPIERLDRPIRQMMVRATGPDEGEAAGPVTHQVSGIAPAPKDLAGIDIRCGDGIIGRVRALAAVPA